MVRIDIAAAKPGDALMEDLQEKVGIPRGTILDHVLIQRIAGARVQTILVERSREAGDSGNVAAAISENIELALRRRGAERDAEQLSEQQVRAVEEIVEHADESIRYIEEIESAEKTAARELNVRVGSRIGSFVNAFRDMLVEGRFNISLLESLVEQIIRDTGANRDTSMLLMHLRRDAEDFLVSHSMNVCLVSLAAGIELSKMMEKRIREPAVRADPKKMAVCNTKILNQRELIELGLAAILHDLSLKQSFPDLHVGYRMRPAEIGKYERHPSETYHLLKKLNVDFGIAKTALQHHERMNGQGYPDGTEGRFLSVSARIIGFADRYSLLVSANPFGKHILPRHALMRMLRDERTQFDPDVLVAFVHAASSFPVGSWVMLDDGSVGYVSAVNPKDYQRPFVRVVYDPSVTALAYKPTVDLCTDKRKVRELVNPESLRLFDPGFESYYMDGRQFARVAVEIPIQIKGPREASAREGKALDLSVGGVRVATPAEIDTGDRVTIELSLPRRKTYTGVAADIMWQKACPDGEHMIGLRFRDLSLSTRKEIHDFVTDRLRQEAAERKRQAPGRA